MNALHCDQVQGFRATAGFLSTSLPGKPGKARTDSHGILLLFLASRPRELVTRAEIIEKLLGKDAFLDTENGINTAIRKVRLALRDDPEEPRFVLTVAGSGYRFIAPIND